MTSTEMTGVLARSAKWLGVTLFVVTACAALSTVFAASPLDVLRTTAGEAFNNQESLGNVLGRGIQVFFGIIGVMLTILLLYAGFMWFNARGDVKAVDKAQELIKEAVIGLVVIMLAQSISYWVLIQLGSKIIGGQ